MNDHDDEQAIPPPDPSWLRPWEREGEPPASTTTFVAPRRKRRSPLSRLGDVLTTRSSAPPETEPPSARQAPPTEAETTEPDSERADLDEQPEDRGPDDAEVDQWHKWFDDLDPTPTPPTDAEPTPEPSDEPQSETPSASAEAPPRSVGVDEPAPAERPHDLPGVAESPEVDLPLADEPTDATDTTDDEPAADETDAPAEAGPETVELEIDEPPAAPAVFLDAPEFDEGLDETEPSASAKAPPAPFHVDELAPADGPHELHDVAVPPGVDGPLAEEPTDATDAADEEPAAGETTTPTRGIDDANENAPAEAVAETDEADEADESQLDLPATPDAPTVEEGLEETEPGASAEAPAAPTELDGRQPPEAALTPSHGDTTLDVVGPPEDEPSDPIEVVAEDEPTADEAPSPAPEQDEGAVAEADEADEAPTEPAQPPDAPAVAEHLDQAEPSAPAEARPGPADVGALAPAGGPDDIPDVAESPDVGFPLADGPTDETEATDEPAADETDAPAEARPGPTDVDALTPADGPHDLPDVAVPPEGDGALLDEPTDAPEAADDERAADDNAPAEAVTETDQAESDESQPEPIAPPDTPEADEHLDETESTASAEAPPTPADVDALAPAEGPHDLPDVAESPRTDLPLADGPTDATDTADDEPAADETDVPAEADTETVEVETDESPAAPTVSLDAPEVDEHLEESETGASAEAVAETDQVEADEAPSEPGTRPDAPEVDEAVDEAGPTASAEAVAETDETDEIESDEFRLDLSTPPDAATDDDSHQAAAAGDPAEAPASPTELDGLQPPEAVLTPPHDDAPLDLVGPPEDEPSDPIEVLAEDEPTADEAPSPAPEQDEDEDAVDEVDEVEADEAPPEPVTVLDVPEVDEHLEETGPRAPAEAPPAPIELDGPEPPEAPIAPQADDAPLDVVWPPEDEPSHATEDLAEDQPATEEAPSLATERAEEAVVDVDVDVDVDEVDQAEADETPPEPIAPPDTPGLVEPLDETESSAPAEAPPTPVETGPTEPAHGLAEAASEAPAPAHASAPAATTVAEPQLDEPDLRETESGPWLRDVDEAARDLDETDRNHRKVLAGAVLSLLVVAVVFGGVRIAQDRAADAAREQAARQTQTTTLATDVLDLADAIGPAAAGAEPLAASLLVTLEEHLLASERSDAELDEARSDAVDELQRLADELREALAGPAPVPGTLVLDDAADPVLLAHARVRAEATALAGEADDAADRAESWGAAVRSVTAALATHARIASEQPETSDPDELAAAWSAELGPLRVLADVAADAATVPGLQDWADVHAVFAADSLTWVQRAVTLLEDGDVEAYNTELEEALGVDDPFGFSAALADGTRTALDSPVLDAVATVEARAALVAQQVDALERTTGERLTAAPTP